MSTAHGQPGLSSEQRSTIRSTILRSRRTLEDELRRQLEKYGIYEDKKLPLDNLAHLSADELHTREKLDAAIERELESTEGDLERSITNYVREATKTYLNRFVALKTIEVRGLVEETIAERAEYGNRSYMHHTVAEIAGELTDAPDDGFGAALDLAYQEIGAEIRMIFDDSEHTAIDLDAQVREEILDDLDAIDHEAWESDEALGWIYQYFGKEEREEIDDRVDNENYKIAGTDIATKTQLFTPRYIVEWMVDNSLGRLWLEMRGESTDINNEENCFNLVSKTNSQTDSEVKDVEDIKVLDPACGSGHILFYAFDVLYQMYLEQANVPEKYIPRKILENNLFGIDIDSGSAEIAALTLFLKAKQKSPDVEISQINIVSADTVLINGDKKERIIENASSEVEKEILEQVWRGFDNIREWGSLVRIEDKIDDIIEEYQDSIQADGQAKFTQSGGLSTQSSLISDGQSESWSEVKARLLEDIKNVANTALEENNTVDEMFANEVGKSIELLDVMVQEYDVVVANPPYLSSRKMDSNLKEFLKSNYRGYRDLYGCFIERCYQYTIDGGYTSLVTPEDYMTQYSYRKLRDFIVSNKQIVEGAHLSGYSFSANDRPFTIPIVFKNQEPSEGRLSTFYRLSEEKEDYDNFDKKIRGLKSVVSSAREGNEHPDIYIVDQSTFKQIGRQPFIYWFGNEVLKLFKQLPNLDDIAEVKQGLATGDDDRFSRAWWEVQEDQIGNRYLPCVMGGGDDDYYESTEKVVLWENSGEEIKEHEGSRPQNEQYYREPGIIYRDFSKVFTARIHEENQLFNLNTRLVFTDSKSEDLYLLSYLNSSLSRYIMDGISSELHYTVGDGKRLPVELDEISELEDLATIAIDQRKLKYELYEESANFDGEVLEEKFLSGEILYNIELFDSIVYVVNSIVDKLVFDEYDISEDTRERIQESIEALPHDLPITDVVNDVLSQSLESKLLSDSPNADLNDYDPIDDKISGEEIKTVSKKLQINPISASQLKYKHELYTSDEKEEMAGRLLSYYLGKMLGRYTSSVTAEDGIVVLNERGPNSFSHLLSEIIDDNNVRPDSAEMIEQWLDYEIDYWMGTHFFKNFHNKIFTRRGQVVPIYWQLESPNGAFSCFIYYHGIDANTLPKLRGQYLDQRIEKLENELETLTAQTSGDNPDKDLLEKREQVQEDLDDIKTFRDTVDRMIDDGITVDVEKGIWENIKEWDQYEVLETGLPKLKSSYSR